MPVTTEDLQQQFHHLVRVCRNVAFEFLGACHEGPAEEGLEVPEFFLGLHGEVGHLEGLCEAHEEEGHDLRADQFVAVGGGVGDEHVDCFVCCLWVCGCVGVCVCVRKYMGIYIGLYILLSYTYTHTHTHLPLSNYTPPHRAAQQSTTTSPPPSGKTETYN